MVDETSGTFPPDGKVIGTISTAHFFSHFYQLVLPPLFPVLALHFDVGYAELGLMMAMFFAASGLAQTPAGFLVDRFGAARVLASGLALQAAAIALVGLAPGFWTVLPLVVLAGLGNSIFHPADFAVLSASVRPSRMARAYSIHALGGILGWAAAPTVVLALAMVLTWQVALGLVGIAGILVALVVLAQVHMLEAGMRGRRHDKGAAPARMRVLMSPAVLASFAYFTLLAVALTGIQTFLPTALPLLQGLDVAQAGLALTGYLVSSAVGTLVGGILADRTAHHERIVGVGLSLAAAIVLTATHVALTLPVLLSALALAGFFVGTTSPARDMLVRAASPEGSTGKVFGFVYSGLDLGATLAPLAIGVLISQGRPALAMSLVPVALAGAIGSAFVLRRDVRRRRDSAAGIDATA